ncbi:MAG: helix-turn-helix domain-containing protein [SAR324 cluster bacterium]|nr:helix-turn-helix domain-containing protein [SAR324 cluster bacterium]
MFNFRLVLSKIQRKSLMQSLSEATKQGQSLRVNRIRSVLAVSDGVPVKQIASVLRVHEDSIRQWIIKYLCGGLSGVRKKLVFPEPAGER